MIKAYFLCRRLPHLSHDAYADRLVREHRAVALEHQPAIRRYVVDVVLDGAGYDSVNQLWLDDAGVLADPARLYRSPESQRAVEADVARFLGEVHGWMGTEQVHRDRAPKGAPSPIAKWILLLRRAEGLSRDAFLEEWRGRHVPLVLERRPGLLRYATAAIETELAPGGGAWDGIAELSAAEGTESPRDLDTPEGRREILASARALVAERLALRVTEFVQK